MGLSPVPVQTWHGAEPSPGEDALASPVAVRMWEGSPVAVQMWYGVSPVPVRMWEGSPVAVQMWETVRRQMRRSLTSFCTSWSFFRASCG